MSTPSVYLCRPCHASLFMKLIINTYQLRCHVVKLVTGTELPKCHVKDAFVAVFFFFSPKPTQLLKFCGRISREWCRID
ncbi:hypothetical protein Nepgr_008906 [Nepenthes gracilis]|uniref:Uncharacterized protein n=1 Tax=Nepenthes gracilis TaxID=150966 RepID=A0AAD3XJX2_NEPGR|nr:hypothetical protein Nepgr_008906 [Nepenthes gracilis]